MDLGAQRLEAGVAIRQVGRVLAHDGDGPGIAAVRQHPGCGPQHRESAFQPVRPAGHGLEQPIGAPALPLFLEGATIEHGPPQDPAVVDTDEEFFDLDLAEKIGKTGLVEQNVRLQRRQNVGDPVALVPQGPGAFTPVTVLAAAAVVAAALGYRRLGRAVLAEPEYAAERAALRGFHLGDPPSPGFKPRGVCSAQAGRDQQARQANRQQQQSHRQLPPVFAGCISRGYTS
jgi:hypothetical protein